MFHVEQCQDRSYKTSFLNIGESISRRSIIMQIFRNDSQPDSGDIRTIPGYEILSDLQKTIAHRYYQEAFESCQVNKGVRMATGMAYEMTKNRISEGTLPDSIANIPQAHVPQAHTMTDATPVEPKVDDQQDAFMAMVNKMLHDYSAAKNPDPEANTSEDILKKNVAGKEAMREDEKKNLAKG
jgi:hypothetical protein